MAPLDFNHASYIGRGNNIRRLLETKVRQHPDKPFVIFIDRNDNEEILTYSQFDEQVNRLANWLLSRGIGKGDFVLCHLANSPAFVITTHACTKIGAAFIPSIVFDVAEDLEYKLNFSETKLVITDTEFWPEFEKCLPNCPSVKDVVIYRPEGDMEGVHFWNDILDGSSSELAPVELGSMDTAQMMFTSGTTARPKGVIHTHANMLYIAETCAKSFAVTPDDRYMLVLPLFHVNAQCISWYPCLYAGASMVLCERFSASRYAPLARKYDTTICSLVAATLRMILAQPESPLDVEVKMWRIPYAIAITDDEWDGFERRFNTTLLDLYGLTETLAPCTIMPIWGEHRRGSVGWPNAGMEITIVDDNRKEVQAGEVGEIAIKGEPGVSLFREYYKNPEATAKELVGKWFYSGDYGKIDEDGYVYFIDRKKDVIQRGGENIAAAEVERVLGEHLALEEWCVISVPDPIRDEAVMALIRFKEGQSATEEEIIDFCKPKMAKFKVPSFVRVWPEDFPKTSIGKIKKNEMRAIVVEDWVFPE